MILAFALEAVTLFDSFCVFSKVLRSIFFVLSVNVHRVRVLIRCGRSSGCDIELMSFSEVQTHQIIVMIVN